MSTRGQAEQSGGRGAAFFMPARLFTPAFTPLSRPRSMIRLD
jgi:hypothetical protein